MHLIIAQCLSRLFFKCTIYLTSQMSVDESIVGGTPHSLGTYDHFDEDPRKNLMPTILKYNGKAKEVYVAGTEEILK